MGNDGIELTPEIKLQINNYISEIIRKWISLIGVASVAVILFAVFYVLIFLKDSVVSTLTGTYQKELTEITKKIAEMNIQVKDLNRDTTSIKDRTAELKQAISEFDKNVDAETMKILIKAADISKSGKDIVNMVYSNSHRLHDIPQKISSGKFLIDGSGSADKKGWHYVTKKNGDPIKYQMWVKVDTSSAGFTKTPEYFVTLTAKGWARNVTSGGVIYSPTKSNFTFFALFPANSPHDLRLVAKEQKWEVSWVGIQKN